ncbi:Cupin domain-containing protein [Pseudoduganella lurida]|uniref:Cupin domain-containing protein n=1 Tax=Pseudoduganella lurida TaxID=1036180 RepID=A0A562REH1_9BURK|nr:cupin domain-containing protein [Pseudoduganella lurida]TWI67462.1 Cupin domain-containing protein [Pseudoduganella lurida]
MALPPIHRVVTGHDDEGKAIIASDGPLAAVVAFDAIPGMVFHEVWEASGMPVPLDNGIDPTTGPTVHGPPKHGVRIRFVDLPPDADYLADAARRIQSLFDEVNNPEGLTTTAESPHPMMHRTEALDYGVVIDGELTLVLDKGEVALRPGSVVVQRGTNHAWANRSGKPCRMLFVQIDGQYAPPIAAALARRHAAS